MYFFWIFPSFHLLPRFDVPPLTAYIVPGNKGRPETVPVKKKKSYNYQPWGDES